jgi:hypothetical protein
MTNDIDELTALNLDFVASAQNSDVRRFDEILAPEFYCSNPDKSLVDRAGFLEQSAPQAPAGNDPRHRPRRCHGRQGPPFSPPRLCQPHAELASRAWPVVNQTGSYWSDVGEARHGASGIVVVCLDSGDQRPE